MSHRTVEHVIDKLLTDEDLRIRFLVDRFDTLADLHLQGLELSQGEIDAFVASDPRMWFWAAEGTGARLQ